MPPRRASMGARAARPGPRSLTLDIHSHVGVPRAAELVEPHLDLSTVPLVHFQSPETQAAQPEAGGRHHDARREPRQAARRPRRHGPRHAAHHAAAAAVLLRRAARHRRQGGAASSTTASPSSSPGSPTASSRFGTVPMPDGSEAAKELERCVAKLGFKGVQILTNVNGKELSDPAFAPFWKKAEELGALVVIHPNGFTHAERLPRFYFNNVIGNPLETTIALHYLIFDGVLERHPNLKILAVHGGGYLGAYCGPHRPRLGGALGLPRRPAEPADELPEEGLFRHGRVHAAASCASSSTPSGPTIPHGHRLPVRHGGLRPGRPRHVGRLRRRHRGEDRRRQRQAAAGALGSSPAQRGRGTAEGGGGGKPTHRAWDCPLHHASHGPPPPSQATGEDSGASSS